MEDVMKALLVVMMLATVATAGVTVTEVPGPSQLHPTDNSGNTTYKPKEGADPPHKQCADALKALNGKGLCWDSFSLLIVTDCADVPAPTIPLVKQTDPATGAVSWLEPDAAARPVAGSSIEWETVQWLYVHNPAWPGGQPDCWVRGWTTDEWRPNGTDPNAPFLERKLEGMADLPDGPLTPEPFYLPGEQPPAAPPPA
jgi:hypothetical protein